MTLKQIMIALVAITLIASTAMAGDIFFADHHHTEDQRLDHGGGLDQCGGHYNRKTGQYHYHRPARC